MSKTYRTVNNFIRPTFVIIGDGECEPWYLKMLVRNEPDLKIKLLPTLQIKKKLADQYKDVIDKASSTLYKRIFWIIDLDTILSETREARKGKKTALQEFKEYCEKLEKRDNVTVIVNNPRLEFWFLLHFEPTDRLFNNCGDATKQLRKLQHLPDYEKTRDYFTRQNNDIYLKLQSRKNVAIENSKKIAQFDFDEMNKSVSEMHILFETLFPETNKK